MHMPDDRPPLDPADQKRWRKEPEMLLQCSGIAYSDMRVLEPRSQLRDDRLIGERRVSGLEARQKLDERVAPWPVHQVGVRKKVAGDTPQAKQGEQTMFRVWQRHLRIGLVPSGLQDERWQYS